VMPGMLRVRGAVRLAETSPYREGRMSLMGLASRIATGFVPQAAERIIDVCAAPGGKSCAMGEDHPKASILAMDISPNRVEEMAEQVRRLGLGNIRVRVHDGQERDDTLADTGDFVLVDAPCSGLGTFHNRPEVKLQKSRGDVRELHYVQRRILEASATYVKPGGRLCYCTCTFTRDENEAVIKGFLEANPGFVLKEFENPCLTDAMRERYRDGQLRLWSHLDDTDCFYLATMERI
jgi:16S rRNA (cytosine967-C5)-methyltransferase